MANLPADRTKLNVAIANQQPSIVASAQANREALVESYDTIDLLNQKVDSYVAGGQLDLFPAVGNGLINSNFDVWQRGISFNSGAAAVYSADRWLFWRTGLVTGGTMQRTTTISIHGQTFIARCGRASGDTSTSQINLAQALDSNISTKMRGKTLTLSFSARSLNNIDFSSAGKLLTVSIAYGTGQNQNAAGTITGLTTVATKSVALLETTFQRFSLTTPILPSSVTQLFVFFSYIPTGTAGPNEAFDLTQVQLNVGSTALPYQPRTYADELRACQRYCIAYTDASGSFTIGHGFANQTTSARIMVPLPVPMRITPSLVATAADWQLTDSVSAGVDVTALTLDTPGSNPLVVVLQPIVASGLTQFRPYRMFADGTGNRILIFDAEM